MEIRKGLVFSTAGTPPLGSLSEMLFKPHTNRFHFGLIADYVADDADWEVRESVGKGVALARLFLDYTGYDVEIYEIVGLTIAEEEAMVREISKFGRCSYDYLLGLKLFADVVKLVLTGHFPPWKPSQFKYTRNNAFWCTEAVNEAALSIGKPIVPVGIYPLPAMFRQAELDGKLGRLYKGDLADLQPAPNQP